MVHSHRLYKPLTDNEKKELRILFKEYYHEDWDLDAPVKNGKPDALGIIDVFISHNYNNKKFLRKLGELIGKYAYLNKDQKNELLDMKMLEDFGCAYSPSEDNLSVAEWLSIISKKLKEAGE